MEAKQHPHFSAEGAAARLRAEIPGSVVEVNVDESNLWVTAVFDAPDYFKAYRKVRSLLLNGVDVDPWPQVHLMWAPDQRAWQLGVIRDAVIEVLKLRPDKGSDLSHKVSLSVSGFTLKIHVCTAGLFDELRTSSDERANIKSGWFRKVAGLDMKLPEGITNVLIQIGDPQSDWMPQPFSSVEDADDGKNPNWPSRTGNASGKGRGNNPPRR